jgi:hypothetical protein
MSYHKNLSIRFSVIETILYKNGIFCLEKYFRALRGWNQAQNIRNLAFDVHTNLQQFLGDQKKYRENVRLEGIRAKFYCILDLFRGQLRLGFDSLAKRGLMLGARYSMGSVRNDRLAVKLQTILTRKKLEGFKSIYEISFERNFGNYEKIKCDLAKNGEILRGKANAQENENFGVELYEKKFKISTLMNYWGKQVFLKKLNAYHKLNNNGKIWALFRQNVDRVSRSYCKENLGIALGKLRGHKNFRGYQ